MTRSSKIMSPARWLKSIGSSSELAWIFFDEPSFMEESVLGLFELPPDDPLDVVLLFGELVCVPELLVVPLLGDLVSEVFLSCFLCFMRRFWNHVFTCVSDKLRAFASSTLSGVERYLCASNLFSRPCSCWSLNTVRALRRRQCFDEGSAPVNNELNGRPGHNNARKKVMWRDQLKLHILPFYIMQAACQQK